MPIDYTVLADRLNELNRSASRIIALAALAKQGNVVGEPLTTEQINGIQARLKSEADSLKDIAGRVKTAVG